MLACEGISVVYPARGGGRRALDEVSCAVRPGKVTVFIGPNGAGKSTLLRVLAGVRRPDAGLVTLSGRYMHQIHPRQRAARIALVSQQPSVAFDFDTRRVVGFGAEGGRSGAGGTPRAAVDAALARFGLGPIAGTPFGALSVGQRQRVSLARAWAQLDAGARPDAFLLADEPLSAMDPAHALAAADAFRELAARGVGVGLVLHDLTASVRLADRAVLLDATGRVAADGPADDVLTDRALSALFGAPIHRAEVPGLGPVLTAGPARGDPAPV